MKNSIGGETWLEKKEGGTRRGRSILVISLKTLYSIRSLFLSLSNHFLSRASRFLFAGRSFCILFVLDYIVIVVIIVIKSRI